MQDEKLTEKVRKLLALAEGASTPEEAELATAQAMKIVRKHALDLALIQEKRGNKGVPTELVINVEAPYATTKSVLLNVIAKSYDVHAVRTESGARQVVVLIGYESDLEAVELLFGSLQVQSAGALAQTVVPWHESPRAFRHAFLLGFANKVGQRLETAKRETVAEAQADGSTGAELVLVSRKAAVDIATRERFPRLKTSRSSTSSRGGGEAGQRAGARADLGQTRFAGSRKQLA